MIQRDFLDFTIEGLSQVQLENEAILPKDSPKIKPFAAKKWL